MSSQLCKANKYLYTVHTFIQEMKLQNALQILDRQILQWNFTIPLLIIQYSNSFIITEIYIQCCIVHKAKQNEPNLLAAQIV